MNRKIRIQYILLLNLLMLLTVLVAFVLVIQWFSTKHKGHLIDQNIEMSNRRIKTIVNMQSSYRYKIVNDYSYWDEMVDFIKYRDDQWGQENVVPLMSTYGFDFTMVYDSGGGLVAVYTKGNELEVMNLIPNVTCSKLIFKTGNFHWYTAHNGHTFEVFGATVHPTADPDKLTPAVGLLVGGNIIGQAYLDSLAYLTDANVSLSDEAEPRIDAGTSEMPLAKWQLNDLDGKALKYLHFTRRPEFLGVFKLWSRTYLFVLITCMALVLLIYFLALVKWVGKPLNLIKQVLDGKINVQKLDGLSKYGMELSSIGDLIKKHAEQQRFMAMLKEKAEESDRLKSVFLANMSHEIRTPINGIIGFSELICQDGLTNDSKDEYRNVIKSCAHELMHIMDDIIEISKIDAGVIKLKPHEFSLSQMLNELEALFSHQIALKEKGIRLIVQKPASELSLFCDGYRLKQMLAILLDNSVKFTEKGHVELTYRFNGEYVLFKVKDTGIGIKKEKRDVIFDRFRQVDEQMARAHGGNGLGLAIFKKLADMMKAEVDVESEVGKGTAFRLKVPVFSSEIEVPS